MNKLNKSVIIGGMAIIALLAFIAVNTMPDKSRDRVAANLGLLAFSPSDSAIIGTHTGTTTTGINFNVTGAGGNSATTTYTFRTGGIINTAIFEFRALLASSTANVNFSFFGSNDSYCEATSSGYFYNPSTGELDMVSLSQINWFDISNHIAGKSNDATLAGTSSITWINPKEEQGKVVVLENLAYECMRLNVSGSSTVLYGAVRIK